MPSCVVSISIILHFVVLYIWYVITLKAKDLDQLYWLVHCISNHSYKHILSYLITIHFFPIKRNRSNQLFQAKIHVHICICAINKINTMHRHHEISQRIISYFSLHWEWRRYFGYLSWSWIIHTPKGVPE